MDFTFLFIVILMLLAVKSNMTWIAVGLFLLLLVTASKSKYLLVAALVGLALVLLTHYVDLGDYFMWVVVGGLFLVLLLISKKEAEHPTPEGYGMGGMY